MKGCFVCKIRSVPLFECTERPRGEFFWCGWHYIEHVNMVHAGLPKAGCQPLADAARAAYSELGIALP